MLDTCSAFNKSLDSIELLQPFQADQHYANKWEEFLAHKALHRSCQGKFADELFPDPKGIATTGAVPHSEDVPLWTDMTMVEEIDGLFTLSPSVTITHIPKDVSSELKNLLIQLPWNQVCTCPASLASTELFPKLPHLFWSACSKGDNQQVDFGILLDTGCSVATTGISAVNLPMDILESSRWPTAWQTSRVLAWYTGKPWMQMVTWY